MADFFKGFGLVEMAPMVLPMAKTRLRTSRLLEISPGRKFSFSRDLNYMHADHICF